jgi:hypothetical protein
LHGFNYFGILVTFEEQGAEVSADFDHFFFVEVAGIERDDIGLGNNELHALSEGIPGGLLKDQTIGGDVELSFVFLPFCDEFAVVAGEDVELDDFRLDAAAALFGSDHVLESLIFFLQQYFGLFYLFLFDF